MLRSNDIMTEVVKQLDLYGSVYNKGNVRTEELYGSNSPIKFIAVDRQKFGLWGTYFFSVNWKNRTVTIDNKTAPFHDTINIIGKNGP